MHAYFLRPGDPTEPITFAVERLRDGQSFSARRTHALQSGRPILSMIASFQTPAQGLDHQLPMPEGVPDPETLPTLHERYGHLTSEASQRWLRQRPMDLRHVEEPTFVVATGIPSAGGSTRQYVWMRAVGPVPDPDGGPHGPQAAALHAAMLAYASDYSLLEPILRAHGRAFAEPGMRMASLDHAMWWHRPARVDQWLLFVLESPSAQGARGLGAARIYTRDGVLVASVAQEGMIRPPRTEPPPPPPSPSPPLSS
jgi:acyl-CoA thioesterase-2